MSTWFVSRHPGARVWLESQDIHIDHQIQHLDVHLVQPGDIVIGTLPFHLAAAVCAKGAHFISLSLELPPGLRGRELSAETLQACGAKLQAFKVEAEDTALTEMSDPAVRDIPKPGVKE